MWCGFAKVCHERYRPVVKQFVATFVATVATVATSYRSDILRWVEIEVWNNKLSSRYVHARTADVTLRPVVYKTSLSRTVVVDQTFTCVPTRNIEIENVFFHMPSHVISHSSAYLKSYLRYHCWMDVWVERISRAYTRFLSRPLLISVTVAILFLKIE